MDSIFIIRLWLVGVLLFDFWCLAPQCFLVIEFLFSFGSIARPFVLVWFVSALVFDMEMIDLSFCSLLRI